MKKSILIGVSIVTILGILLAAVALGFADTKTRFNAFTSVEADKNTSNTIAIIEANNETQKSISFRVIEPDENGAVQQAQSNVSFRILEPMYIPSGYKFKSAGGTKFVGVANDIDMASFSYKNGDEQLTIKETIVVKTKQKTEPPPLPKDTREIVDLNGIEGRFSEENGIKLLGWKIGNLSLSIMSWKNEGQNQTESSLGKEEMVKVAESIKGTQEYSAPASSQEVKFYAEISLAAGSAGENLQKIYWKINLTNTGGKTAENVSANVILHPEIVSRLTGSSSNSAAWDNLQPGFRAGLSGSATINATGLNKQDISSWDPPARVKVTWTEDETKKEQIIPVENTGEIAVATAETAIADAQAKVSFKMLKPSYIPEGFTLNIAQTSGAKFHGVSLELEQIILSYTKGNESLNLQELLVIKDDTDVSESVSKTPYKFVDINGTQGRFLVEQSGIKSLDWKAGNLSMTISSYAYNESGFTGTPLSMEEMVKMARSAR